MPKKAYKNIREAISEIEKCRKSIYLLKNKYRPDFSDLNEARTIGKTLISNIYNLCEGLLYVLCFAKADIHGTEEWPMLKDLLTQGDCVDASYEARVAAAGMAQIKKDVDKREITPDDLEIFLKAAIGFVEWIIKEFFTIRIDQNSSEIQDVLRDCFETAKFLENTLYDWESELR